MTPRLDLRALDDRVLPPAARGLRRLVDALGTAGRPGGRRPAVPGLLALVLAGTVLAGAVLAGVVLAGAAALLRGGPDEPAPGGTAARGAAAPRLAVVHLERHAAPDELTPLLAGTQVRRLYLHAAPAGPAAEVVVLPVEGADPASLLPPLCAATSERRARDARDFTTHAERLPGTTPAEQQVLVELQEQAARAAAEAQAFAGSCTTAFAAAVEAPQQALDELAGRAGVRAVEPAPAGTAVDDLAVPPLLAGSAAAEGAP